MASRKSASKPLVRCDICGAGNPRIRRVTRSYGSGKDLLVIENIPLVSCPACGESYLTAGTLRELERLKVNRHTVATGRKVEVVRFAA